MLGRVTSIQPRWAPPAIVAAVAGTMLAARTTTTLDDTLVQVVQTVLPALFAATTVRWALRERSTAWTILSVFPLTYAVAQIGWTFSGAVSGPSQEGTTWDTVYLVGLPFGLLGLGWLAFTGMQKGHRLRIVLDTAVVAASMLVLVWAALINRPSAATPLPASVIDGLPFLAVDVTAAAIVITAAIYQPGRWFLRWVALDTVLAPLVDVESLTRIHGAPPSTLSRVMWMLAPLTLLAATCSWDGLSKKFAVTTDRRSWLYYLVGAAALTTGWALRRDGELDIPVIWLSIALLLAICANQAVQFREVRGLMKDAEDASAAQRRSEIRFRNAFDGAPVGIAVLDGTMVRSANPALGRLLGFQPEALIGVDARAFIDTDAVPESTPDDWLPLSGSVEGREQVFYWRTPDGNDRWIHLTLARQSDRTREHIAILQDITDRQEAHERLAHLAVTDSLTGLANRAAFLDAVSEALDEGDTIAVAFIDLDRFKAINDTLGHAAGDQVLRVVADRLREAADPDDTVARLAGDEFTMMLRDATTEKVDRVLDTASSALRDPVELGEGGSTQPLASIGLAWGRPGLTADALLALADAAMYRAKASGINQVAADEAPSTHPRTEDTSLIAELHQEIERDEFAIHYQPVIHLATGEVVGHEAFVRWRHPTRGLLLPGEFLPAAETTGLLIPLGSWVLHTALHQLARWERGRSAPPMTMSVNVAAPQLCDEFVDLLERSLTVTGVMPTQVWLEVTESTLMVDVHRTRAVIDRLRALGVRLSIDDFGTGYSALGHLHRFPVDGIKIDGEFVSGLGVTRRDNAICQSVTSLALGLGLTVVAEGIETSQQLDLLQAMGCTHGQGWLFGRARPADDIPIGDAATPDVQVSTVSADRQV